MGGRQLKRWNKSHLSGGMSGGVIQNEKNFEEKVILSAIQLHFWDEMMKKPIFGDGQRHPCLIVPHSYHWQRALGNIFESSRVSFPVRHHRF